jgi:hypothetical protein
VGAVGSGLVKAQLGFHLLAEGATIAAVVLLVAATSARRAVAPVVPG